MKRKVNEAGKRHSEKDLASIQTIHDATAELGANCTAVWPWESAVPAGGEYLWEAALPMNQSHDDRRGFIRAALMQDLGVTSADYWTSNGPYVVDLFDEAVVYSHQSKLCKRAYTIEYGTSGTDPKVTLGKYSRVHRAYADTKEGSHAEALLWSDVMITPKSALVIEGIVLDVPAGAVVESAGISSYPVKLIAPGWGSSGYYSKEMLKRDGPSVFKAGTHMYMNHPTAAEERARPEGDLNNLAAVLTEDAKWHDTHKEGPGLYSNFKLFSDHAAKIKEKGPYTGASIRAFAGQVEEGEAEGKKGKIIKSLVRAESVDFVTKAGAGGKPLVEGERPPEPHNNSHKEKESMTEQEVAAQAALRETDRKRIADLEATNAALVLGQNQAVATAMYIESFAAKGLTLSVEAAKAMAAAPPMKDGKVDAEAIKKVAEGVTGSKKQGGKVVNLGGSGESGDEDAEAKKALAAQEAGLTEVFEGFGLTEAAIKIAVGGRA